MIIEHANFLNFIKRGLSVIAYLPFAILLRVFSIKIPYFSVERIGHLVVDPESFLKEHFLEHNRFPRAILLSPINFVANKDLLNYWNQYFFVIKNPIICRFLMPLCFHPLLESDEKYAFVFNKTSSIYKTSASWKNREPLLKLTAKDKNDGKKILKKLGLEESDWFICVHARGGGYSPTDENLHSFRNTSIEDFIPAVQFINSVGGKCIRMGDASMPPVPKDSGFIDYALSSYKSDAMDIFLCSECFFFLGSNSGIFELSSLFGTPAAVVNMAPMSILPRDSKVISLPMLYSYSNSTEHILFEEIMLTDKSNYRTQEEFSNGGITLVPNKPEEILELAIEQYQRITNIFSTSDPQETLHNKYKALFKPGHYGYGFASRIGEKFLQRHRELLP